MTAVGDLDAVVAVVAWTAVAVCALGMVGLAVSWVVRRRRPAATGAVTGPFTGSGGVPPGPDPDPGPDPCEDSSSPSRSADTRRAGTRSTDRR